MGRRSEHSMDQIREMALDAAEKIVDEEGIDTLSTRRIAAKMGYTSGTLYMVFRNLDDLVLKLNQRTFLRMYEALSAAAAIPAEPRESVRHISRAYIDFGQKHFRRWELIFQRHWPASFVYPSWYQAEIGRCFHVVEEALGRLLKGKVPDASIPLATRSLWCSMHGIHALHGSGRLARLGISGLNELVDYQVDVFLKGVAP